MAFDQNVIFVNTICHSGNAATVLRIIPIHVSGFRSSFNVRLWLGLTRKYKWSTIPLAMILNLVDFFFSCQQHRIKWPGISTRITHFFAFSLQPGHFCSSRGQHGKYSFVCGQNLVDKNKLEAKITIWSSLASGYTCFYTVFLTVHVLIFVFWNVRTLTQNYQYYMSVVNVY